MTGSVEQMLEGLRAEAERRARAELEPILAIAGEAWSGARGRASRAASWFPTLPGGTVSAKLKASTI